MRMRMVARVMMAIVVVVIVMMAIIMVAIVVVMIVFCTALATGRTLWLVNEALSI